MQNYSIDQFKIDTGSITIEQLEQAQEELRYALVSPPVGKPTNELNELLALVKHKIVVRKIASHRHRNSD